MACSRHILITVDSVMSRKDLLETLRSYSLLNKSSMKNHLSLNSILLWKTQGQSMWEVPRTWQAINRTHMFVNIRYLLKMFSKVPTIKSIVFQIWHHSIFFNSVIQDFFFWTFLCLKTSSIPVLKAEKYSLGNLVDLSKLFKWEYRVLKTPCLIMVVEYLLLLLSSHTQNTNLHHLIISP